jgi:hypothetical protein
MESFAPQLKIHLEGASHFAESVKVLSLGGRRASFPGICGDILSILAVHSF